ncbi:MAG: ATP-binding protein [Polyangiaceae bacterium]
MAASGRIQRRLAFAIVITALIPVFVAIFLADSMVRQAAAKFFVPEVGSRLDQSLGLYQELARTMKTAMRNAADAVASNQALRSAAVDRDAAAAQRELDQAFRKYPSLVSLEVLDAEGKRLAHADRGRPVDAAKENKLEVSRPLAEPPPEGVVGEEEPEDGLGEDDDVAPPVPRLVAVFAADKARFDELAEMSQFVDTYKQVERRKTMDEQSYVYAFAALLGITIIMAVGVGTLLARGVSSRLGGLSEATTKVGAGDLSVRVAEDGNDEITDLARAFNRMLGEIESSRARIEYLQRIGAWQEMARRLAHEIKNPLTPIQLAVQEVHRRYDGSDEHFQKLIDTTLEIVEDEVGTLRRLVGEFSNFARLPQAELEELDLRNLLQEWSEHLDVADDDATVVVPRGVELSFDLPSQPARVFLDRQMFRRVLINLVRNAGQAVEGEQSRSGSVRVRLSSEGETFLLDVDDNGPGIPDDLRDTVFDPYVTTKSEGTGLGLAIVKKIVIEHGGSIVADHSPLGGARMRVRLPAASSALGKQLLEARTLPPPPSSRRSSQV